MKRLAIATAVTVMAAPALAYLLSGEVILERMAEHRADLALTSMVAHGTFAFHGPEGEKVREALALQPGGELNVTGRAIYKMPGRCRVELDGPVGAEAPAVSNVNGTLKVVGPELPSLKLFASTVCPLLAGRGGDGATALARANGIDIGKVALGRLDGTIAYVLGARAKDVNVPSLWIGKERFAPLRVVFKRPEGVYDFTLRDYTSAAAGEWHPRVVEIRRSDALVARLSVERVEPNVKISTAIF